MQWQSLAKVLARLGLDILAMPADKKRPALALAGEAGMMTSHSPDEAVADRTFIRATPPAPDHGACLEFERVVRGIGYRVTAIDLPFAGDADVIHCGHEHILTWGEAEATERRLLGRNTPIYGTNRASRERISALLDNERVVEMQLIDPRYPRGSLCACGLGPGHRVLMVNVNAFDDDARRLILAGKIKAADYIIPLADKDAAMYAANSFQVTDRNGRHHLIVPEGISDELLGRIEGVGVRPVPVQLSEWIKKDHGSVKALLCDLGWMCDDRRTQAPEVVEFRKSIRVNPG